MNGSKHHNENKAEQKERNLVAYQHCETFLHTHASLKVNFLQIIQIMIALNLGIGMNDEVAWTAFHWDRISLIFSFKWKSECFEFKELFQSASDLFSTLF
jgi:hypothetical protein